MAFPWKRRLSPDANLRRAQLPAMMGSAAALQRNVPRVRQSCRASPAHAFQIALPTSVLARSVRRKPQARNTSAYLPRARQGRNRATRWSVNRRWCTDNTLTSAFQRRNTSSANAPLCHRASHGRAASRRPSIFLFDAHVVRVRTTCMANGVADLEVHVRPFPAPPHWPGGSRHPPLSCAAGIQARRAVRAWSPA